MNFSDDNIEALTIDCVIFGFKNTELFVLIVKHDQGNTKGQWALPGGWIHYNESLDKAAYRILNNQTGVENIYLEQFQVFGEIDRYPNKRVLTVCYYALINIEDYEVQAGSSVSEVVWVNVQKLPEMAYDHNDIFKKCLLHFQHKVQYEPVGFNLLPEKFTLLKLQELYEAILNHKLDKPNFRRKMLNMNLLVSCDEKETEVSHRAANLYKFDQEIYNKLIEKGFSFQV